MSMDESLQIDERGEAERIAYRYVGYDIGDLERALNINTTSESETIQAAIHTAALQEDAERSKVVLCRDCRYWTPLVNRAGGECVPPGSKKEPWPGHPYHDTQGCDGDFGCVCGVRR